MADMNCWQFNHCPRDRYEVCSAFTKKAGKSCWLVAGTLCEGKVQGFLASKIGDCRKCDFFIQATTSRL